VHDALFVLFHWDEGKRMNGWIDGYQSEGEKEGRKAGWQVVRARQENVFVP
jgi:hypothetical protein